MKRIVKYAAIMCITALILSFTAFAAEEEKTETSVQDFFDDVDRFIKVGEKPDLTVGRVEFEYSDGSSEVVPLTDEMLPEGFDSSVPGIVNTTLTVKDKDFTLSFIVLDESVSMRRFDDVVRTYWGYNKIRRCVMAGFLKGESETLFNTSGDMTRAQFCQMMYNIYKNDKEVMNTATEISFIDIKSGKWYYNAVMACAESGIVKGLGNGAFGPDEPISRQDAAIIMMRILIGNDELEAVDAEKTLETARADGIAAGDFDETADYAKKAVAASLGVIYFGDGAGNITPQNNISRAECASMMSNYYFRGYVDNAEKYLIYLSPSNQNTNPYADGVKALDGTPANEGQQMQLVGARVGQLLTDMGYEVFTAKAETSIHDRGPEAGAMKADAYIAIHSNAMSGENDGRYQGSNCYYNGSNTGAKELSKAIFDRLATLTPTEDGGSFNDMLAARPYVEVRLPEMANLIIETEYHDYAPYAEWIVSHTEELATAITLGIDDYFKTVK